MTVKERLLNSIRGIPADKVAWSPFLAYYWDFLPSEIQAAGQVRYLQELDADPLLRGFHTLFRKSFLHTRVRTQTSGKYWETSYETPVGTLREQYTFVTKANTWFLSRHPVQDAEQLKTLCYLFEDMRIEPDYQSFLEDYSRLGDDGLYLPVIGADLKTAFQALVEHWIGTEALVYMLCDDPNVFDACLPVMWERDDETVKISLQTPAEGFIFWEDSSTTNINPQMFERFTAPEVNRWGERIHREGKLLVHHACGHIRDLIPLMAKTNIDAIESISPPPTGNVELREARAMLEGKGIALIGGIEPTVLLDSTMEELEAYVTRLLYEMKGFPYILANSDSCPPGVSKEKFLLVSRLVENR